jgi:hypothetical protein
LAVKITALKLLGALLGEPSGEVILKLSTSEGEVEISMSADEFAGSLPFLVAAAGEIEARRRDSLTRGEPATISAVPVESATLHRVGPGMWGVGFRLSGTQSDLWLAVPEEGLRRLSQTVRGPLPRAPSGRRTRH